MENKQNVRLHAFFMSVPNLFLLLIGHPGAVCLQHIYSMAKQQNAPKAGKQVSSQKVTLGSLLEKGLDALTQAAKLYNALKK